MAPPKKPNRLKLLNGSRRLDPSEGEGLPPLEDVPAPPEWLPNGHALREWERLASLLHATGLLSEGCLGPLAHLCSLHGEIVKHYIAGMTPTGHLLAQYRALVGEFGLTPVSAGRVTPSSSKKKNKFANGGPGSRSTD